MKAMACPKVVLMYNSSMGVFTWWVCWFPYNKGIDKKNRIDRKRQVADISKVFWHMLDIAKANSWILYWIRLKLLNFSANKHQPLAADFTADIATFLIHIRKFIENQNGALYKQAE